MVLTERLLPHTWSLHTAVKPVAGPTRQSAVCGAFLETPIDRTAKRTPRTRGVPDVQLKRPPTGGRRAASIRQLRAVDRRAAQDHLRDRDERTPLDHRSPRRLWRAAS